MLSGSRAPPADYGGWMLDVIRQLDHAVGEGVQSLRTPILDDVFKQLSELGWLNLVVLIAALGLSIRWRTFRPFPTVLAAILVTSRATAALKDGFDRLRPPLDDHAIRAIVPLPHNPSFPSGHASGAFALAVSFGLLVPRVRIPALVLAALIGLSRIWLGVHYLSDVIAGALLGTAVALAAHYLSLGLASMPRRASRGRSAPPPRPAAPR